MFLVGDDVEGRAGLGGVQQVPLAPSQHEDEVFPVVEVALGNDSPRPEAALYPLLMAHLKYVPESWGKIPNHGER